MEIKELKWSQKKINAKCLFARNNYRLLTPKGTK